MARDSGVHDDLVLVEEAELGEGERELDAAGEQVLAGLLLELPDGGREIAAQELRVQAEVVRVLETTYFFAASMALAKGSAGSEASGRQ